MKHEKHREERKGKRKNKELENFKSLLVYHCMSPYKQH